MNVTEVLNKLRLVVDLDTQGVPTRTYWEGSRVLQDDNGNDVSNVEPWQQDAPTAEVDQLMQNAIGSQTAQVANLSAANAALQRQLAAVTKERDALQMKVDRIDILINPPTP